jgi:hypothetical protein
MVRNNIPKNHRIEKYCQLFDICFAMVDWPKATRARASTNLCISSSLVNFLNYNISNR